MTVFRYSILVLFFGACLSLRTLAAAPEHDHVPVGEWGIDIGLGYAAIDNPLNKRGSLESYVLPQWYYYGERFYIENLELGYSLIETDTFVVDLYGYLNDDGVLFNADKKTISFLDVSKFKPNVGRPPSGPLELQEIEREFTYMAGLQFMWMTEYVDVRFIRAKDISAGHDGVESTLSLQKSYAWNRWRFFWELGAISKSEQLNNYYYGIRVEEAGFRSDLEVTAESLTNYYLKLATTYKISPRVTAVLSLHQTWMHDDLVISPLLLKDNYLSGFAGINVHF